MIAVADSSTLRYRYAELDFRWPSKAAGWRHRNRQITDI